VVGNYEKTHPNKAFDRKQGFGTFDLKEVYMTEFKCDKGSNGNFLYEKKQSVFTVYADCITIDGCNPRVPDTFIKNLFLSINGHNTL
jgi:hypothetical protein